MRMPSVSAGLLNAGALLLAACIALGLRPPHAFGQTPGGPAPAVAPARATPIQHQAISFEVGLGKLVSLQSPAANVFVADPKVVEVRPGSATTLFVFGVGVGRTTIAALDDAGAAVAELDVTVRPAETVAIEAQSALRRLLPGTRIRVAAHRRGLMASGDAANPAEAARAMSFLKGYVSETQTVEDQMGVQGPVQVTLRVRIAEISRSVTRNLGINWQAIGSIGRIGALPALLLNMNAAALTCGTSLNCQGVGFNGVIDALAQDNLARILAEPNLTVLSGQPASFLAGGEFPIPVGQQAGQVTIEFKKYGVNLTFLPTVLSDGRINLKVSPEVSQLTTQGAVTLAAGNSSIQIPALTVRRADTMIELGSGQSFAVAGLLQDTVTQSDSGLPGLGDLPVLGSLFRSDKFIRNETELVIIVTPYVVRPVDDPAALQLAGANYTPPTDLERILRLRQLGKTASAAPLPRLPGQAGFIVQ
jgi:pilus assembly protein CpaC